MDFDYQTDLTNGDFQITLTNNPQGVVGNRALLNRFELTFLTKRRQFVYNGQYIVDTYGGDAQKFVNKSSVLNDLQSISAAISVAIDNTVTSMINDQPSNLLDTEKLSSAQLLNINVINGVVVAVIQIIPVEAESNDIIKLELPIIKRSIS